MTNCLRTGLVTGGDMTISFGKCIFGGEDLTSCLRTGFFGGDKVVAERLRIECDVLEPFRVEGFFDRERVLGKRPCLVRVDDARYHILENFVSKYNSFHIHDDDDDSISPGVFGFLTNSEFFASSSEESSISRSCAEKQPLATTFLPMIHAEVHAIDGSCHYPICW